jgi:hypothetical protein
MKGTLNPELKVGDRIICYHMEGETGVPAGTTGTVSNISKDPFEDNGNIISVIWDNGSRLSLLSVTDAWKMAKPKKIEEAKASSLSKEYNFVANNPDIFQNFDWRFLRKYLFVLRETGIVNMYGASPLLYSGKEFIDRHYGDMLTDNDDDDNFDTRQEKFNELLEMADKAKDKMIQGTLKYLESKGEEIEIDRVNNVIRRLSQKILELYWSL